MNKYKITGLVIALLLGGCVSVPDINTHSPVQIKNPLGQVTQQEPLNVISSQWWRSFNDSQLNTLIENILKNNPDYKIALLNSEKSLDAIDLAQTNLSPQVNLDGSVQRQRLSEKAFYPPPLAGSYINFAQLSLKGNYNLDFFGKTQSLVQEQEFKADAIALNEKTIELMLSVQTLKLYGYWQYLNEQDIFLDEQIKLSKKFITLTEFKIKNGTSIQEELLTAKNTLKSIEVSKAEIEVNKQATLNSLGKLTGQTESVILFPSNLLQNTINPVASINSNVIENRPEVASYLLNIKAQKEKMNSLKADFYPSISLTGEIGLQKIGLGQFLKPGNIFSNFGPAIHLPIFDAGKIKTNYKIGEIDLNIFIEQYNQAVIKSFYDINDSLFKVKTGFQILNVQKESFQNEDVKFSLAKTKNKLGKSSEYEMIQNELGYINQKKQQSSAQLTYFNSNVELINALGGIVKGS